jgi:hypothetical protein
MLDCDDGGRDAKKLGVDPAEKKVPRTCCRALPLDHWPRWLTARDTLIVSVSPESNLYRKAKSSASSVNGAV